MRFPAHSRLVAVMSALALVTSGLVATLAPTVTQAATGTNLALATAGGTVTASGNEVADGRWTPEKVIDGDTTSATSRWSSNYSDQAHITVKLAQATVIDHVNIYWEAACAARYKIQVSNDGTTFTDATGEIVPMCAQSDSQKLNAATAGTAWQYIRMQGLDRTPIGSQKYGISLYEFQVWNGTEPAPVDSPNLVPLPQEVTVGQGEPFVLNGNTRIEATGAAVPIANLLAERFRTSTGLPLPVVASAPTNSIRLVLDAAYTELPSPSAGEGYKLTVNATGAVITAKAAHGLFNGTQTLRQVFPALIEAKQLVHRSWSAAPITVEDAPRFGHRGIQIDSARSFVKPDEVKKIIDTIASFKQSRVHLHLADDQGWRIQITNEGKAAGDPVDYTRLTEISGRSSMLAHPNNANGELGRSGFYTQAEYSDIVAYAAARFVTVVPEIDVPGHTTALLHAIPQLNSAGSKPVATVYGTAKEQNNGNVGESTLDVNNPQTFVSLRHIFGQIAALTPGKYFHMGGDESHVTPHDQYVSFVRQSIAIIRDLGKSAVGWNEFAEAGLTTGDVVQYWVGGTAVTQQAIAAGAKVVVSKSDSSYLDMKYNGKTPLGLTWAGTGDLDKYYNWNPATVIGGAAQESDLLGVEAPLWSETHRGGDNNEFLIFPRAIAHAEVGWSQQADRNVADFLGRMDGIGPRLAAAQSNFYDGRLVKWGTDAAGTEAKAATGTASRVAPATVVAPGTKIAEGGASIAVDATDDADGISASALTAPLTATINFGDGSATVPATFSTETPRDGVHAAGLYQVGADHSYANAGTYTVVVTLSDGRTASGKVTVTADYTAPVKPVIDECVAPVMTLEKTTSRDDARFGVDLAGFKANEYLVVSWDGNRIGTVRSDAAGKAAYQHYVPYQATTGDHLLRVTDSAGRFVEKVVTVDSKVAPPRGAAITGVKATASSEATNEPAPNGYAAAMVDGQNATFWHSKWAAPAAEYPHTLTFDLGKTYNLNAINWVPRQGSANGQVKGIEISVSADGTTWGSPVKTMDLPAGSGATVIDLVATARYVKIVATSPQAAASAFATVAEMGFRGLEPGQTEPEVKPVVAATWTPPAACEGTTTPPVTTPPVTTPPVTTPPVTTPPVTTPPVTTPPVTTPPAASPTPSHTWIPVTDHYTTPGYHDNGRKWFTKCEPYGATFRCWAYIWATQVRYTGGGKYVAETGWHFNNLTYLAAPRAIWTGNPLGNAGTWKDVNGRQWRTECGTPATGRDGCRTYIWTTNVVSAEKQANGTYRYFVTSKWVFNNMVLFVPGS